MDLELAGKRALVTGGSRGLGRQIALALAREGVRLAIAARSLAQVEATAREIANECGQDVLPLVVDVGDDASVDQMSAAVLEAMGGIDILINNAATPGGGNVGKIGELDVVKLLAEVNIKTGGYLRLARAFSPSMLVNGWGRIVNIGGLAARVSGNYNAGIRCASISALTKNLADELGSRGVSAIAVHPHLLSDGGIADSVKDRVAMSTIPGRLVGGADVAWFVTILCSPRNRVVNGETIQVGGGFKGVINY